VAFDTASWASAAELVLELLRERTPCAEEKRLEGGRRHVEDRGDLLVRPAFELAEDDRLALLRGSGRAP
jgi:hypothetical protein